MGTILFHGLLDNVFPTEQCFQDHIRYPRPKQVHINAYLLEVLAEGGEGPFIAKIVLFGILVHDEVLIFLIDGIVGEVHVFVVFVDF